MFVGLQSIPSPGDFRAKSEFNKVRFFHVRFDIRNSLTFTFNFSVDRVGSMTYGNPLNLD